MPSTTCAANDCSKTDNLKRCAKCETTAYCSRDCQKSDWKTHKKTCTKNIPSTSANPSTSTTSSSAQGTSTSASGGTPKGLTALVEKPFTKLSTKTWLYSRPEKDVYKLLIDTFRLRQQDNFTFEGHADDNSIYSGASNSVAGFQRFLSLAASRPGLLPPWWSSSKAEECKQLGLEGGWTSLTKMTEKGDVIEHYGDSKMPMQMRMFGEQVYGTGPGGQPGEAMMKMMMMSESGGMTSSLFGI